MAPKNHPTGRGKNWNGFALAFFCPQGEGGGGGGERRRPYKKVGFQGKKGKGGERWVPALATLVFQGKERKGRGKVPSFSFLWFFGGEKKAKPACSWGKGVKKGKTAWLLWFNRRGGEKPNPPGKPVETREEKQRRKK